MSVQQKAMDELGERQFRGLSRMPISEDRKKVFGVMAELIRLQSIGNSSGGEESWVAKDPRLNSAIEYMAPEGTGGKILQNVMFEVPPASRIRVPLLNTLTMGPRTVAHTIKAYRRPSTLCTMILTGLRNSLRTEHNGTSKEADEEVRKLWEIVGEDKEVKA